MRTEEAEVLQSLAGSIETVAHLQFHLLTLKMASEVLANVWTSAERPVRRKHRDTRLEVVFGVSLEP